MPRLTKTLRKRGLTRDDLKRMAEGDPPDPEASRGRE
jgi:hypothetical protein